MLLHRVFDGPILFSGVVLRRVHEQLYFPGSFVAFVYTWYIFSGVLHLLRDDGFYLIHECSCAVG